jgi:membrane protease YdiL (CAAX protease family)
MNDSNLLSKFIGTKRWRILFSALKKQFYAPQLADKSIVAIFVALLLCAAGPLTSAFEVKYRAGTTQLSTLAFGISAVFAILFQRSIRRNSSGLSNKETLSLTHTAFALGCIPALLVVALDPSLLAQREQLLSASSGGNAPQLDKLMLLGMIGLFTLWVAVIEEYLFRGLLLSILRRASFLPTPFWRTSVACLLSAVLFGLAHYPLWGGAAAMALTGIGLGLALGYIANGEKIWPMILYHWGFDFLSTSLALFS